jgi:hypothetical protein
VIRAIRRGDDDQIGCIFERIELLEKLGYFFRFIRIDITRPRRDE